MHASQCQGQKESVCGNERQFDAAIGIFFCQTKIAR